MKKIVVFASILVIGVMIGAAVSAFAPAKTYQVTGPVLESRPDAIVVQKGTEKWEISRDSSTKVTGDPKVGAKVTVVYRMSAAEITVAAATPAKKK